MAYLRPPLFVRRIFNPIARRIGTMGVTTLEVPRRRSGSAQRIPVIPVEHAGDRYIVSTRGESEWVRNLRAAGGGELRHRGRRERFAAVEVPAAERAPILEAYREEAGRAVKAYFDKLPDPADHPTFRLDPRT